MDFLIECVADLKRFEEFITQRAKDLIIVRGHVNNDYETKLSLHSMHADEKNNAIQVTLEYKDVDPSSIQYNLKHHVDVSRGLITLSDYEWQKYINSIQE